MALEHELKGVVPIDKKLVHYRLYFVYFGKRRLNHGESFDDSCK